MKIVTINYHDTHGGAARIAATIHQGMLDRGHNSSFFVGIKKGELPFTKKIQELPPCNNLWGKFLWKLRSPWENRRGEKGTGIALNTYRWLASPSTELLRMQGYEIYNYPGTNILDELIQDKIEIIHLHNLHQNYFDLRKLVDFSNALPTAITLHDEWLYTGHCAYTLGCNRWQTGCGNCPDLTIYPPIKKDKTRENLLTKKKIFEQCKLNIVAPSKWLMSRAENSILEKGIINKRVIENGVNQLVFKPGDQKEARKSLNIPIDAKVVLFQTSRNPLDNRFKDFQTIIKTLLTLLNEDTTENILAIGVGNQDLKSYITHPQIRNDGYFYHQEILAKYYQASDVFIHAAHSEVFGLVIAEALSCGIPVVATDVGGIPEQIKHDENGYLVAKKDSDGMARYTKRILKDIELQKRLSKNAIKTANPRFGVSRMLNEYESFYREIIEE